MERKNIFALGALAVLVVLAVFSLRSPEKGDRVGERPRPIAEVKAGTIAALEVTQPGGKDKVTLAKKGDKWQVTSPYDKPADQGAAKAAVEALEKLKWGDIVTQKKETHGELEVSDDKAVHVVAKDSGGATLVDLYLGKIAGSATMVRVNGKDEVWQANDLYASTFKREGKTWREHAIFDLKADDADKVTIKGGGATVKLERVPPPKGADGKDAKDEKPSSIYDAKWRIVESDSPSIKAGDGSVVIDHGVVNRIAQGLSTLRANEFLDIAKPEELGLAPGAPGQIEITVEYKGKDAKDNKTAGVRIGQQKGEDYFVQTLDNPQIFSVKKWAMEALARIPQDIRDKTLVTLKSDQLAEVTVTQDKDVVALKYDDKAKAWKADKLADADDAKVKAVAESFDNLTATGFIPPGATELASLAKPTVTTVTLKPKAGAPIVIKVGDTRGDEVAVQKAGAGSPGSMDPMWLKKYQVDRFLKKPADLQKDKK
ncbi:MAG: DUF4340 domain-containing protein [Polyangia bacterium]